MNKKQLGDVVSSLVNGRVLVVFFISLSVLYDLETQNVSTVICALAKLLEIHTFLIEYNQNLHV